MVEVRLAGEDAGHGAQVIVQFRPPAAALTVDHMGGDKAPDPAVPPLKPGIVADLAQHRCRRDAFGQRPPVAVGPVGPVIPGQRIVKPALRPVPADVAGVQEQGLRRLGQPGMGAPAQLPQLHQQARPFQRMARRGARRAEHRVSGIGAVHRPVGGEMLGHAPAFGAGMAVDDQRRDALGHGQVQAVARCLEGGHQRFGQVHVAVLAAITAHGLPVGGVFLGRGPGSLIPEAGEQHIGHIGQQGIGIGVAHDFGRRSCQQHEGMAVGLLAGIDRARIIDCPVPAATLPVLMPSAQEFHAVIDHPVCPRQAQQMGHRKAMHHPRGVMQAAHRAARIRCGQRLAPVIQTEESAPGVDRRPLEKAEQPARLIQQPGPVNRAAQKIRSARRGPVGGVGMGHLGISGSRALADFRSSSRSPARLICTGPARSNSPFSRRCIPSSLISVSI